MLSGTKILIVILGPTGSGKSEIAIRIAKEFNGEIVSADSRQIYKEMNIGTAKVPIKKPLFLYKGIKHHLLDIVSPKKKFTIVQYRNLALKTINKIFKKNKIPILCGGTGFYIQAVIDGIVIPEVEPDWKLRKNLEKKSEKELFVQLKKLDPRRAKTIDKANKRRLIRALEIIIKTKKPVPILKKKPLPYPVLLIGIDIKEEELKKRIKKRIKKMFKMNLEKEVRKLFKNYGWVSSLQQTIGYQEWKDFFENKITKKQVKDLIILHTIQFAKRQMVWFKRDKRIFWLKNFKEIKKLLKNLQN